MFVLATDGDIVPKPIDAIRHVLETIITERERANSSRETMANIRPPRDSRLKSTIGLNITEDENVLMKLHEQQKKKESERKPNQKRKSSTAASSSVSKKPRNSIRMQQNQRQAISSKDVNKENHSINDPTIQFHVELLNTALKLTETAEYEENLSDDDIAFE